MSENVEMPNNEGDNRQRILLADDESSIRRPEGFIIHMVAFIYVSSASSCFCTASKDV